MIESMPTTDIANAERFERVGVSATPELAARMRDEFAQWLQSFFALDAERSSDAVLAINEALANCAEFAYLQAVDVGTMDLRVAYDAASSTLTAVVEDRGEWRLTDAHADTRTRGRGIPLMRSLSDRAAIESSVDGTKVTLAWVNVGRR